MPTQPKYTVKQAANLIGISPNRLRMWQKRFTFIQPQRALNGYRLYSDTDVKILRYIAQQTDQNIPLITFSGKEEEMLLEEANAWERSRLQAFNEQAPHNQEEHITELLMARDSLGFQRFLQQQYTGLSAVESVYTIDLPVLHDIGESYHKGNIDIIAEHLGSNLIQTHVSSVLYTLGCQGGQNPVLLACPPRDFHSLGLIAGAVGLAAAGVPYQNLGASTPLEQMIEFANYTKPRAAVLSISKSLPTSELQHLQSVLKEHLSCPIAVSGYEAIKQKENIFPTIQLLHTFSDLVPWVLRSTAQVLH